MELLTLLVPEAMAVLDLSVGEVIHSQAKPPVIILTDECKVLNLCSTKSSYEIFSSSKKCLNCFEKDKKNRKKLCCYTQYALHVDLKSATFLLFYYPFLLLCLVI